MKKTLLLQTALVAAVGIFAADIASAQTKAQPLSVSVGGYLVPSGMWWTFERVA